MLTLRPFQTAMIEQIIASAAKHHNIAVIASTGSGKTVIASALMHRFAAKNRKVLFLVDNVTLIKQTAIKLNSLSYGIIASGYPEPTYDQHNIFIASLQTLTNRPYWHDQHWDLIILDECHETSWRKTALMLVEKSTKWVIGLTATPYRLSNKQCFADIFEDAVISPSFAELQEMGYLAPLDYFGVDHADFSKVKVSQGDYVVKEVSKIVNNDESINQALDAYQKFGAGKRAIAFAVDVEHAKNICEIANRNGIVAKTITGEDKAEYREAVFEECKQGKVQLLVSCMALTKGFDLPQIEVGLLMRPSKSLAIIEQQIGRVARIAEGKERGIIIDCVGNLAQPHVGYPCDRIHTKESVLSRKPPKEAGEAPVKICPQCERIIRAVERTCPHCEYVFPVKKKETIDFSGEVSQLITAKMVKDDGTEAAHREFYRQLLRKHYKNSYCTSGAYTEYVAKKFVAYPKPLPKWALGAIFGGDDSKYELFAKTVTRGANMRFRGNAPSWIVMDMIKKEFGAVKKQGLALNY